MEILVRKGQVGDERYVRLVEYLMQKMVSHMSVRPRGRDGDQDLFKDHFIIIERFLTPKRPAVESGWIRHDHEGYSPSDIAYLV